MNDSWLTAFGKPFLLLSLEAEQHEQLKSVFEPLDSLTSCMIVVFTMVLTRTFATSVLLVITILVMAIVLTLMLVAPYFTAAGVIFAETHLGKMSILSTLVAFAGLDTLVGTASILVVVGFFICPQVSL